MANIFPNGLLIDLLLWLSIPLWIYTLSTVSKHKWYWILSVVVCIQWCLFDIYIKAWHGAVLNALCIIALGRGYRRYKNGTK